MSEELIVCSLLLFPLFYLLVMLFALKSADYFKPRPSLTELPPVQHASSPHVITHKVRHLGRVPIEITTHHEPFNTEED